MKISDQRGLILVMVSIFCLILTSDGHYSRIIFRRYETILVSIFLTKLVGSVNFSRLNRPQRV